MKGNRSTEEVEPIYHRHIKMVYQICLMLMKNVPDAEDAAQTVFRKVMEYPKPFRDPEHEKAWLIVTAQNTCKSMLRRVYRRHVSLSEAENVMVEDKADGIMEEILKLPEKEKTAIYLHYYEGYSGAEIARLLKCRESTIFSYLHRGRKRLKKRLEEQL